MKIKAKLIAALVIVTATVSYGLALHTITETITDVDDAGMSNYKAFDWKWSGHNDEKFIVNWPITPDKVALRLSYPRNGTVFLDILEGATYTNIVTTGAQSVCTVVRTNLPPSGTYYAEFLNYETTTDSANTRTIARGKIKIDHSVFENTTQSTWVNPLAGTQIGPPIHTLTASSNWPFLTTSANLIDLVDVSTNAPTDGQVLAWDATSGDWTNATAGAGSGDLTEMQVSGGMLTVASGTGPIPVVGLTTSAVQTAVGISNYVLGSATNVLASTADLSAYLPLAGGTMTGALDMDASNLTFGGGLVVAPTLSGEVTFENDGFGTLTHLFTGTGVTINNLLHDSDFTIKGDNDSFLFVADGGLGMIGVGTNVPAYKLHSYGAIAAQNTSGGNPTNHLIVARNTAGTEVASIDGNGEIRGGNVVTGDLLANGEIDFTGAALASAIAMGANKITGLGLATAGTDGANLNNVNTAATNSYNWAVLDAGGGGGGSAGGLVWISAAQFFSFDTTSNEWGHLIHELDSASYKLEGTGIHSTSSTAQAGRLRATVAVPKGSTSWATTDAIKIKWWGDDTAGDAKIIRVDMWGRDAVGTRNVIELFTPSGGSKTATLLNVPEEMKWDAADLTLGTIYDTVTIEITLGTANSNAAWINGVMLDFD